MSYHDLSDYECATLQDFLANDDLEGAIQKYRAWTGASLKGARKALADLSWSKADGPTFATETPADWVSDDVPEDEGKDTNPKDAVAGFKIPLWLLSPIAKAHWALAQFLGALKYGSWNWRAKGVRVSVYLSAIGRHADAFASGEECDPVDGVHHLGAIMACCGILLDAQAAGKLIDDRPPVVGIRPTYARLESLMEKIKGQYAHCSPKHYRVGDVADVTGPDQVGRRGED